MRMYINLYESEDADGCFVFVMWPEDNDGQCGEEWVVGRIQFDDIRFFVGRCFHTTRVNEDAQPGYAARLGKGA